MTSARNLSLLRRWVVARVRLTLRNPRALLFTFAFPLILMTVFNALNSNAHVAAMGDAGGKVPFAQFYTPSIGIFGLASACYTGVAFGIATARDAGLLKRVRGTPLPMAIYLCSWLTGAALTGIAAVAILFAVAVPAFGVHVYARMLPAALVTLALGAATLSALGLAVASLVRTADQAIPVAQLTFLPLSFISGIFYPLQGAPGWVVHVAHAFPLFHIVNAFDGCFVARTPGGGWSGGDLAVIAIWGVAGLAVAARRLRARAGQRGASPAPQTGQRRSIDMNAVAAGDADSERSAVLARPRLVPSGTPAFRADDVRVTFGSVVALGRRSRSV